jgi:hypothetical protein
LTPPQKHSPEIAIVHLHLRVEVVGVIARPRVS